MNGLTYGKRITKARMDAKLTQHNLADDINVKRETLSRWERDMLKVTPSAAEIDRLVRRLPDLTEVELLFSLGYKLSGLVDHQGRPLTKMAEELLLLDSLDDLERAVVRNLRRLEPLQKRIVLQQILSAADLLEKHRPSEPASFPPRRRRHPDEP